MTPTPSAPGTTFTMARRLSRGRASRAVPSPAGDIRSYYLKGASAMTATLPCPCDKHSGDLVPWRLFKAHRIQAWREGKDFGAESRLWAEAEAEAERFRGMERGMDAGEALQAEEAEAERLRGMERGVEAGEALQAKEAEAERLRGMERGVEAGEALQAKG